MRVKCLGGTLARFLSNVIVFCNCSAQQAFCFGWNAIVVRITNPGQIEIEEGGGQEEKLTLRGQARSQSQSKHNSKKKTDDINVHPSSTISLCFILEWAIFCRFPVTRGQLSTLSLSLSPSVWSKFNYRKIPKISPPQLVIQKPSVTSSLRM